MHMSVGGQHSLKNLSLTPVLDNRQPANNGAGVKYDVTETETEAWAAELEKRGLRVFMDRPESGTRFLDLVRDGLKHSLALVPMITPNVQIRDHADNRVAREVNARRNYFPPAQQIYPAVFGPARPELIVPGVTPIMVTSRD